MCGVRGPSAAKTVMAFKLGRGPVRRPKPDSSVFYRMQQDQLLKLSHKVVILDPLIASNQSMVIGAHGPSGVLAVEHVERGTGTGPEHVQIPCRPTGEVNAQLLMEQRKLLKLKMLFVPSAPAQ